MKLCADYRVGPVVGSYSLGRSATMGFRRKPDKRRKGKWGNIGKKPKMAPEGETDVVDVRNEIFQEVLSYDARFNLKQTQLQKHHGHGSHVCRPRMVTREYKHVSCGFLYAHTQSMLAQDCTFECVCVHAPPCMT